MSLDVFLTKLIETQIYENNITHNLTEMAKEAGLYYCLWRPEEIGITKAEQLIKPLQKGLELLLSEPDRFTNLNPTNGWGSYEGLVAFTKQYLDACMKEPNANVSVSR